MKYALLKKVRVRGSAVRRMSGSPGGTSAAFIGLLIGTVLLAVAGSAYNRATLKDRNVGKPPNTLPPVQATAPKGRGIHTKLALQPEADKLRRRLGQRFLVPGKERATLVGTLIIGTNQSQVRLVRTQNDEGEIVEIMLGGAPVSRTWSAANGAIVDGHPALGDERSLIERLALDSPDQFILAQLRGAAYYTVAHNVQPAGTSDPEVYVGPVWDLIRVREPEGEAQNRSQSSWRLYHVNSASGLIDRAISQEPGGTVVAEFSQ